MRNHSPAWKELLVKYPHGFWPINTVDNLRASWKTWCSYPGRKNLRADEFQALEAAFRDAAEKMRVMLLTDGNSEVMDYGKE
jgi:hypothetical protein